MKDKIEAMLKAAIKDGGRSACVETLEEVLALFDESYPPLITQEEAIELFGRQLRHLDIMVVEAIYDKEK